MYIVQSYEEDYTILQICWVVGPCSPEQWFQLSSLNTAQTTGKLLTFELGNLEKN